MGPQKSQTRLSDTSPLMCPRRQACASFASGPPIWWLLCVLSQWDESGGQRRDQRGRVRTPRLSPTGGRGLTPAPARPPSPGSRSLSLPWSLRPGVLMSPVGTSPQHCTILCGFFPSSPHLCTLYFDRHR